MARLTNNSITDLQIESVSTVLQEYIGKKYDVSFAGSSKKRNGTLKSVTNRFVSFEFTLGKYHTELTTYLIIDLIRGKILICDEEINLKINEKIMD